MKYILLGIICITLVYSISFEGYRIYKKLIAKKTMIKFFIQYKDFFSAIISYNIISYQDFDDFKMKVISFAVDEMPAKDIVLCQIFFDLEADRDKELKIYNEFLNKAGILRKPLRFEKNPLERLIYND